MNRLTEPARPHPACYSPAGGRDHPTHPTTRPTAAPLLAAATGIAAATGTQSRRLGVCTHSSGIHWKLARTGGPGVRFRNALEFLDHCHALGAGGVQIAVGAGESTEAASIRQRTEKHGMYFEGMTTLPADTSGAERFEREIRLAKEAGATIVRTAALSGRRYETFDTLAAFEEFQNRTWKGLTLAEPILRRLQVRLALENHKDWLADDLAADLRRLDSEWIGVCLDTGNNLALLEDPYTVVETLAPFTISTHLKDMGVERCGAGFLLSEVPLGAGCLDLKRIVGMILAANPAVRFNLEMITRDPLLIPCLTPKYWATMPGAPARRLAAALRFVADHAGATLPRTTDLTPERQAALEDANVRASFERSAEFIPA